MILSWPNKAFWCLVIGGMLLQFCGKAQLLPANSNIRVKQVAVVDSLQIDSLTIAFGSFKILGIADSSFIFNPINKLLVWKQKPQLDSVTITYRVLPFDFSKKYLHKAIDSISTAMGGSGRIYYQDLEEATTNKSFIDFGNMDYSGALSRAISLGNNQDLALNSQFNLQMNGMLGDSIMLTASMTDNNIPFQPEGNTQNIQEFDKVFVQLQKNKMRLQAGDHELFRPNGYFMNFYKRVQGFYFNNETAIGKQWQYKYGGGASLAKGKFIRNTITALEGNQGPYKINGPNGEIYFILLANTERIYIDGILKQRGEDKDYIIDYNTAEIIFMPRNMITKDSRIIVEYEFNDRNYLNSLLFTQHDWSSKKTSFFLNMYSNQDAKNQPFQQQLDKTQIDFLSTIGDSISLARVPSARLDTFDINKIMYQKKDTLFNGVTYSIFQYSTDQDSAKYVVNFSFVGERNGNYTTGNNLANGRVYVWSPPINGQPTGSYDAATPIVTPKRLQMYNAGVQHSFAGNNTIKAEIALSRNDPNLFSAINDDQHIGLAAKTAWQQNSNLKKHKAILWKKELSYEFVQNRFQALERFRSAEFTRDWNLNFTPQAANEHIATAATQLSNANKWLLAYQFDYYKRIGLYEGLRNTANLMYSYKKSKVTGIFNQVSNSTATQQANYLRPSIAWQQDFKKGELGLKCSLENNTVKNINRDSVLPGAFAFEVAQVYWKSKEDKKNKFGLDYFTRRDRLVKNSALEKATLSHNFTAQTEITSMKKQNLRVQTTYRRLLVFDSLLYGGGAENNLLGRVEYSAQILHNAIAYTTLYEVGAGQDLKREFAYLEVPQGQGTHVWRDYNNDGVPQLNEFEIALFANDKKYIRVFTPTNIYVRSKFNNFNQNIIFQPAALIQKGHAKWKKRLNYFYIQNSIQLSKRILGGDANIYNPFSTSDLSSILSSAENYNTTIFFNRLSPKWGLDYTNLYNTNRTLLTYGIDTRSNAEQQLKLRYNISKRYLFQTTGRTGVRSFSSPFLDGRSYKFGVNGVEPSINFQNLKSTLRLVLSGKYESRINEVQYGGEKAFFVVGGLECRYSAADNSSFNGRASYNNINFNGKEQSSIGYIMLDGLVNGNNYLWQMGYERRVAKGLELSIDYEGRKPGTLNIIHTGRASVRAVF